MKMIRTRILSLAVSVALLSCAHDSARAADDPASELATFQIADGFDVRLFASEQHGVVKPIQIRFDARGRLWVIGSTVYPQLKPGEQPNDKVLILEDTNGDGQSDKTIVFADGLMIPTGLEVGHGGAYIGHGTELLFLKDTNGDDIADERRVVLRGFGTGDNHQNINSFRWGPAGELWMSQGLHTHSRVETPWGISRLDQAGIWRFWPHRLKLEGFFGSEHEPQNPWGFVFTHWGEPIVLAGNNSSPIYPVPGLILNHRSAPPPLIWKNGNGRKTSGGDIVGTSHFPDSWQGLLILGGYINNAVWTLKISDDNSGFVLEDSPALIKSSSRSFRPVDVKFGPDGALYICDWYNPIIGHYQASFRHPDRDKAHGRIWRVTAKNRPLTPRPNLASASNQQLLDHLKSGDRWTRSFAKRTLADRPAHEVIPALEQWLTAQFLTEHNLIEALGVFQSHEQVNLPLLRKLCRATDPGARAYAAGAIGSWADRIENPLSLLHPLAVDPHPRVRLQAVVASTYIPTVQSIELALLAADQPVDRFLTYALHQAVFALKPYWLPAFRSSQLNLPDSQLAFLVRADNSPDTLSAVRDLLQNPQLNSSRRNVCLRILADHGAPEDLAQVMKLADASNRAQLLPLIAASSRTRKVVPAGDLAASLAPLLNDPHPANRAEALKLAGLWKIQSFQSTIHAAALDPAAPEILRRAAAESLGLFANPESKATLSQLARDGSSSVQSAAIAALATVDPVTAAEAAALTLAQEKYANLAPEIFTAFLQRLDGSAVLTHAMEKQPPSRAAAEAGLTLMNATGRRPPDLARLLSASAGQDPKPFTLDQIDHLISEARSSGNPQRGKAVFERPQLGCVACHAVSGQGGKIGPDLSALGTAQPLDFIAGAIIDPQKEIKEGYTSISVLTTSGEELQGQLLNETREELVLRDVLQDRQVRLRRDQVKERRSSGSVMPAGLADTLTPAEFRDLLRYLSELGRP